MKYTPPIHHNTKQKYELMQERRKLVSTDSWQNTRAKHEYDY